MSEQDLSVSIIIPCYNVERTVAETLRSISQQTHKNYEVILINDGSVDNTERILNEYATSEENIKCFFQKNKGQANARNYGLSLAQGEFVVFVDADDKLHPNFLEECLSVFKNDSSVNMVYTEMQTFERENNIYNLREFKLCEFLITNCIPIFCMIRTANMKAIGGFDIDMDNNEDWECWIRLYREFKGRVVKIHKVLYYYRKRYEENSVSDLSVKNQKNEDSFRYVYNKHYAFYKEQNLGIWDLFYAYIQRGTMHSKYYNIWYKRLFYKYFDKKRYKEISDAIPFSEIKH